MRKNHLPLCLLSVLAAVILLFPAQAQAQFRSAIDVQEWPAGKVVLTSGDTIYGAVTYHRTEEIINVKDANGNLRTFAPVNVQYFVAQEQPSGRPYTFRTLQWDLGREYSDFKKPTFFEQLNQGPLTLIMREQYLNPQLTNPNSYMKQGYYEQGYYTLNPEWLEQIEELYYVLLPNEEIVTLRNVRRDLHRLFGKNSRKVKKFVRQHNLSYEKPHQVVAIVNYFNSLVTEQAFNTVGAE